MILILNYSRNKLKLKKKSVLELQSKSKLEAGEEWKCCKTNLIITGKMTKGRGQDEFTRFIFTQSLWKVAKNKGKKHNHPTTFLYHIA